MDIIVNRLIIINMLHVPNSAMIKVSQFVIVHSSLIANCIVNNASATNLHIMDMYVLVKGHLGLSCNSLHTACNYKPFFVN